MTMWLLLLAALPQTPSALPAKEQILKAPAPKPSYRFSVTPETIVKLGSVGPKEVKTVAYTIKNVSDKPLAFQVADLSPGTTATVEAFAAPLQPGESRAFTVTVDPAGWVAYQRRAIKLVPDDATQPTFITRIEMTVRPEMSVDGVTKSLGEVAPHESPELVYTFTREGGDPAQIRLASELPPYLESEVVNLGAKSELHLTLRPRKLKAGQLAGLELVKVETNAPKEPSFSLYLDWRLGSPFKVDPARLSFESRDMARQPLTLSSKDGKPFKILKAELEGAGFAFGIFDKATRPASGSVGPLPAYAAPKFVLPVWLVADKEAHAVLRIYLEGQDDPLVVPLNFLPPVSTVRPAEGPKK